MSEHQLPKLKTPVFDQPAVWKIQSSPPLDPERSSASWRLLDHSLKVRA
jgi:hypothetical protein